MVTNSITSWGGTIASAPVGVEPLTNQLPTECKTGLLVHGLGRSYGDVCLNNGGLILRANGSGDTIDFNPMSGVLKASSGVDIQTINSHTIPHGWIVRVLPGTSQVTLGGAIANDIHGKNHYRQGTFGCHVRSFTLLKSDGVVRLCSPSEHSDLFAATVGGLGLTGAILDVELQLLKITSSNVEAISVKTDSLQDTLDVLEEADREAEYTVAWVDLMGSQSTWGRGHVLIGNHAPAGKGLEELKSLPRSSRLPDIGRAVMNRTTVSIGNVLRYNMQLKRKKFLQLSLNEFFHPLDGIVGWNRAYGSRGFFQYQFVVPDSQAGSFALRGILSELANQSIPPYLAVVKRFGTVASPGLMSFPMPGITIAIDIPNVGPQVLDALSNCDALLLECGGRVYPAKDARMSSSDFKRMYPQWEQLEQLRDPAFSSSFWRRMMD